MKDTRAERRLGWVTVDGQRYPREKAADWLEAVEKGLCPFCGEGPFVLVAMHVRRVHGIGADDLREMLGLQSGTSICDPALAAIKAANARDSGHIRFIQPSADDRKRGKDRQARQSRDRDRSIVADYLSEELTIMEIAAAHHCHKRTVRNALLRAGVQLVDGRSRRRRVEIARGVGTPVGRRTS